ERPDSQQVLGIIFSLIPADAECQSRHPIESARRAPSIRLEGIVPCDKPVQRAQDEQWLCRWFDLRQIVPCPVRVPEKCVLAPPFLPHQGLEFYEVRAERATITGPVKDVSEVLLGD